MGGRECGCSLGASAQQCALAAPRARRPDPALAGLCSCGARATGSPPRPLVGRSFQPVAQRAVIAALEAPFLTLALSRLDQVLQTPRALHCGLPALSAAPVALHSQLVFPLPRNRQASELVFNAFSHFVLLRLVKYYLSSFDQSIGFSVQTSIIFSPHCHAKLVAGSGRRSGTTGKLVSLTDPPMAGGASILLGKLLPGFVLARRSRRRRRGVARLGTWGGSSRR